MATCRLHFITSAAYHPACFGRRDWSSSEIMAESSLILYEEAPFSLEAFRPSPAMKVMMFATWGACGGGLGRVFFLTRRWKCRIETWNFDQTFSPLSQAGKVGKGWGGRASSSSCVGGCEHEDEYTHHHHQRTRQTDGLVTRSTSYSEWSGRGGKGECVGFLLQCGSLGYITLITERMESSSIYPLPLPNLSLLGGCINLGGLFLAW